MAASLSHTVQFVDAAGTRVQIRRGGHGSPLLVIHGEFGVPGWLEAYDRLAKNHDVIVPSLPGYDQTPRLDWIMGARDVAAWVTWLARSLDIRSPVDVIGCSLGGWVAAEIATIAPQFINRMVLVGAMGIKPDQGEIFDYFLESARTGLRRALFRSDDSAEFTRYFGQEWSPEQADVIEQHREMTCRIAWKPYMHSLTLRSFLPSIQTPTLIVWGSEDAVTPVNCGEIYQQGIKGSRLTVIEGVGHMPEMESPDQFADVVRAFLQPT